MTDTTQLIVPIKPEREARIFELEQALKREPAKEYRRELVSEYLYLTEPELKEINL